MERMRNFLSALFVVGCGSGWGLDLFFLINWSHPVVFGGPQGSGIWFVFKRRRFPTKILGNDVCCKVLHFVVILN